MNKSIPCELIEDLLPSYVEELTNPITNEIIKEHISFCSNCENTLKRMQEPESRPQEELQEINYLKKYHSGTKKSALYAALGVFLLFILLLSAKYFFTNTKTTSTDVMYCNVQVNNTNIHLQGKLTTSAYSHAKFFEEDGILNVQLYKENSTPWRTTKFTEDFIPSGKIKTIYLNDVIVWDNSSTITVGEIYATKHSYIGDMNANGKVCNALQLPRDFGNFKHELQTTKEPYDWKLILENQLDTSKEKNMINLMKKKSCLILALIDNLGSVTFQYQTFDSNKKITNTKTFTFTTEDASNMAGMDIKTCGSSAYQFERLVETIGYTS